jgi:hypothetical protein
MNDTVQVHLNDGQDIPLPADIAANDDLIRKALAPFYPDVANAEIRRADGKITIIKRAGPKG